jgi:hypothetical protein
MKKIIYIFSFLLLTFSTTAQNFDIDYEPLQAQGKIPKEIITASTTKYEQNKENITRQDDRKIRKDKDKFYLQSSFVIDEMMRSGRILFNDELSVYVNQVADKLLAHDEKLRKSLNFYVVKSPAVNAFATDRGSIFINIGLLARLEDEAQLAYVLAHEIVHYQKQHNIQTYVEFAKIERQNSYQRSRNYERLVEKNNYSKELEREADDEGLDIFLKSDYNFESILRVFDILDLAHAPYTNKVFSPTFLETPNIKFTSNYLLEQVDKIEPYETDSDESTHPSVSERRGKLLDQLIGKPEGQGQTYLVSEAVFKKVRKIARFELCNLFLQRQAYVPAIYHAYVLLQDHPNNHFLRKIVSKSLYGLAQYRNAERYNEINPYSYKDYQGEIQKVYYLFEKLEDNDLNVLAGFYAWKIHQEFPESKGLELMARDMIEDIVIYQIEEPFEFFKKERVGKLAKADSTFARYGFGDLIDNETIKKWLENGQKYRKKFADNDEYYDSKEGQKEQRKKKRQDRTKGKSLGIEKVTFINPMYVEINARKETAYRFVESEATQKKFKEWIRDNGERLDLNTEILDVNNLSSSTKSIEEYRNLVIMSDWIDEYLTHDMFMINSNYDEAVAIADKQGSDYFAYAGAISYRNYFNAMQMYAGIGYYIFVPPLGVKALIKSSYETLHFNLVFDVRQNKKVLSEVNFANYKGKDMIIRQNLYWSMLQMKREAEAATEE